MGIKIVIISFFILWANSLFADQCVSEDICPLIDTVEGILTGDTYTKDELGQFKSRLEEFITYKEGELTALGITSPDVDRLKSYLPVLDSKIALSDCGATGELYDGFIEDYSGAPCNCGQSSLLQHGAAVDDLTIAGRQIGNFVVADGLEEKLTDDALTQILDLCSQGGERDKQRIRSCAYDRFGQQFITGASKIPEYAEERLNDLLEDYTPRGANRDPEMTRTVNTFMNDLRGGECESAERYYMSGEGVTISHWTASSNSLDNIEQTLTQSCSPIQAMQIIDGLFMAGGNAQGWTTSDMEGIHARLQEMWRTQHDRGQAMINSMIQEVGPTALGGEIYNCLMQFPPPQMSIHSPGFNISRRLINGTRECDEFTTAEIQNARLDAASIAAKEAKSKEELRDKKGSERYLAEMARDNPHLLGEIFQEMGYECSGIICGALQNASILDQKEERREKWRRIGIMIGGGVTAILAFTPLAPIAIPAGAVLGAVSIASAAVDLHNKGEQIRAVKFALMGDLDDMPAQELARMQSLEREFDALVLELALEIGFTTIDLIEFAKIFTNMDDYVRALKNIRQGGRHALDNARSACF